MNLNSENKIKIILVTGFLGSGKTTFLNKLIEYYSSKKIGVIVNDFGKIAVDGMLLSDLISKSGEKSKTIYEISNGSIFCSCLSSELVKSLKYFTEFQPDVLIIETSGLSDPSTFRKILTENKLGIIYNLTASFCIFDSIKSMKLADKIVAIEKQIKSSNIILINKSDLISEKEFIEIKKFILSKNGRAKLFKTVFTDIDFTVLNNLDTNFNQETKTFSTVSTRPGSIILNRKEITKNMLIEFYEKIKYKILRIKGYLRINDEVFYISDNNYKLQIQKSDKDIRQFGLSVLFPSDTIAYVENNWEKTINNKILRK